MVDGIISTARKMLRVGTGGAKMDSPWITVVVIMALPLGFIIVPAMVDLVAGRRRKEGVRRPTTR